MPRQWQKAVSTLIAMLYTLCIIKVIDMDNDKYKDISPYKGEEFAKAKERLMSKREYLGAFACLIAGNDIEKINQILEFISSQMDKVNNYFDFQKYITAGIFIPAILEKTTTGFSTSGGDKLDPNKGYLFISTHRDIILDCMLLDYALFKANRPTCEMAFGDNLIINQFVEDLFRVNGGVIVKRNLPMREKYLSTIELSEYFVDTIADNNTSIWVAQKSGRSKDGNDNTQPAIIKMLYLSKRGSGITFPDLIKKVNIVPVAISYQYNPNDINNGREEILTQQQGKYEKKKYEDVISMVRGMRCNKGRINVAIGTPLTGEYSTPDEVAREIDRQIHLNYKLFNTNYIAYDYLENTNRFESEYDGLTIDGFLSRYNHLKPEVREAVLNSYANPVRSMLREKGDA